MRALYSVGCLWMGFGLRLGLGLWLGLGIVGCDGADGGVPPEIRGLTLGATTNPMPMGDDEVVHGVFEFTDPDGDAESIAFEVLLPDGTVQDLPPQPVDGLGDHRLGTVSFSLTYSRDTMGRYEVTVWLVDSQGLVSNRLTGDTYSRM